MDETAEKGERPVDLVARLAAAKAAAVALQQPQAWIIGADQVALRLDENGAEMVLGKPGSALRCAEQLQGCSGRGVSYLTAVAVTRHAGGECFAFMDTTKVLFRTLDPSVIERYIEREAPFDCAGGFKSEGLGITLCESIDSVDPTALIGLPLICLSAVLRSVGFELP